MQIRQNRSQVLFIGLVWTFKIQPAGPGRGSYNPYAQSARILVPRSHNDHVQTFSFYQENHCSPGRNQKCIYVHALSPGQKMALLGKIWATSNQGEVGPGKVSSGRRTICITSLGLTPPRNQKKWSWGKGPHLPDTKVTPVWRRHGGAAAPAPTTDQEGRGEKLSATPCWLLTL